MSSSLHHGSSPAFLEDQVGGNDLNVPCESNEGIYILNNSNTRVDCRKTKDTDNSQLPADAGIEPQKWGFIRQAQGNKFIQVTGAANQPFRIVYFRYKL